MMLTFLSHQCVTVLNKVTISPFSFNDFDVDFSQCVTVLNKVNCCFDYYDVDIFCHTRMHSEWFSWWSWHDGLFVRFMLTFLAYRMIQDAPRMIIVIHVGFSLMVLNRMMLTFLPCRMIQNGSGWWGLMPRRDLYLQVLKYFKLVDVNC